MVKLKVFDMDMADCLVNEETIEHYINEVLEDGNEEEFKDAIDYTVRSKGFSDIANKIGTDKESLYKTLGTEPKDIINSILRVIKDLQLVQH